MSDMRSDSENVVDIYYVSLPVESPDQAVSLVNYLNAHGTEAFSDSEEVRCPVTTDQQAADIRALQRSWRKFWQHSDSEVFGLSIYVKPVSAQKCPHEG